MKVFISWSGERSRKIGEQLRDWLPTVLQSVDPYFTPEDTEKGTRWLSEISQELSASKIGIFCVTRDNINSNWLLFEAGVLSKELEKTYVCPILFGVKPVDLAPPMRQFQATEFTKDDFKRLIDVINDRMSSGQGKLLPKVLDNSFKAFWPQIEKNIGEILASVPHESDQPTRTDRELLEEIHQATNSILGMRTALPSPLVASLIEQFIDLHDNQATSKGGYQDVLDILRTMRADIAQIIRYGEASRQMLSLATRFQDLTYKVRPTRSKPPQEYSEDDVPF